SLESAKKKTTSSVQDVANKPAFGSRFLKNEEEVWTQNAWDHVPAPDEQDETISAALLKQRSNPVPLDEKIRYNEKPAKHWDNFYKHNAENFFKNRKWLHNEFPELVAAMRQGAGPSIIAEIGCGAGNSAFPLLASNENPELRIHAYDYASHAVKLVQNNPLYQTTPVGSIQASVWDLSSKNGLPADLAPGTVDIVVLVFVLSALHPDEWIQAIDNIHTMLKPGGLVVLRDYGRYDLTQIRFKGGRMLDENFYIRGDKTRVYFFELGGKATAAQHAHSTTTVEQEKEIGEPSRTFSDKLTSNGSGTETIDIEGFNQLQVSDSLTPTPSDLSSPPEEPSVSAVEKSSPGEPVIHPNLLSDASVSRHPLFRTTQLGVDRRLLVNRKRQLKMYRVWMQ
ncbi:methyltransferase, partial [Coprinopsis marcescibilis]